VPSLAYSRTLTPGGAGDTLFPVPPSLQENVKFWRDVFSRYKISEIVYHDEIHLGRIYEVKSLGQAWNSSRSQKRSIRHRKKQIKRVLSDLANGRTPPSGEGRLVARMRKIFAKQSRSSIRRAVSQIRSQPGLKERFRASYVRSGKYLPRFRRTFKKYGLPLNLTLLPHVESGFRESIYSHAGASGMWQFTRSTGRLFMRVDWTIDARRDPYISADAAARLLKRNYEDLKSWPLALTAYNHGAVGMRRAVQRVGTKDIGAIVRRYNGRTFGFASRNFYAEFIAAVQVHKNSKKYFGDVRTESPVQFSVFHLPSYVKWDELSRRIGIDRKVLRKFNPALRSSVVRRRRRIPRGYPLRVPGRDIASIRKSYYKNVSKKFVQNEKEDSSKWVWIRSGDSLGRIARRYRVTVSALKRENALQGNLIVVGDRLRIPEKGKSRKVKKETAKKKLEIAKNNKTKKPNQVQVARLETPKKKEKKKPSVSPAIQSRKSNSANQPSTPIGPVEAQEVKNSWTISALDIPHLLPERGSQLRREALREVLAVKSSRGGKMGWVKVHENETIGHFSDWLRVSRREIRRINRIRPKRGVRMGKKIRISFRRVSKEKFMEKRIAFHRSIEKQFHKKYSISKTNRHKLKQGENVWTLVMQTYKVPLWLFRQYNDKKDLRRISAGEEIIIPVLEPRSF
jgi:membrane-bound lytic murein transglycosylase D